MKSSRIENRPLNSMGVRNGALTKAKPFGVRKLPPTIVSLPFQLPVFASPKFAGAASERTANIVNWILRKISIMRNALRRVKKSVVIHDSENLVGVKPSVKR